MYTALYSEMQREKKIVQLAIAQVCKYDHRQVPFKKIKQKRQNGKKSFRHKGTNIFSLQHLQFFSLIFKIFVWLVYHMMMHSNSFFLTPTRTRVKLISNESFLYGCSCWICV